MVTAMPLNKGKMSLTSGDYTTTIFHCEEDGDLIFTFTDGSTGTFSFVAGDDRVIGETIDYLTISSGSFTIA